MPECFTIWSNEIEGRLDVESNFKRANSPKNFLIFKDFQIAELGDISQLRRGPFGGSIKKEIFVEETPNGYQVYEQYNAINNNSKRARYFISEVDFQRLKSFSVQENDILMSCSGTIGKLTVIPQDFREGVINQALLRIRLNPDINLKYFVVIFKYIIEKLIEGNEFAYGSAIRNVVSVKEMKKIKIPIPPSKTQNRIVEIMQSAYSTKKQKEAEARQLLDSINDYVLDELGIKLLELKDKMTYVVSSEEVENNRADAYYYQPKFEEVEKAIKKGKFEVKELKEFIKINDKLEDIKKYNQINYIDLASINKNFGVIQEINQLTSEEAPSRARQKLEEGDLLLSGLSGSLKSIAVFDGSFDNSICSTGFYVIKNSKDYNNYYLWALFRSSAYQSLLNRETTGAIMSSINREALLNLKIPLPPLSVQNKIAEEVKRRMQKAEQLQKEAKEELEKAKQEVEKMILGE